MGVIEAIKRGFVIATKNLGLVLILFVFNAIWNIASLPFMPQPGTTPAPQATVGAFIFTAVFILISIFIQGGSLGLVRDYIKAGSMKLASLASYGLKYYLRLLVLGLLIVLIILIAGLIAALIIAVTAPLNNVPVTVVAAIIAVIIAIVALYYLLLLLMSPYALVCEEAGIIESMKKSMNIVKRNLGKVLLLLVLLILVSLGIGFIIGFVTGLITIVLPAAAGQIVIGVVNGAFNGYLGVVMMASFTAFYLALKEKDKTTTGKVF